MNSKNRTWYITETMSDKGKKNKLSTNEQNQNSIQRPKIWLTKPAVPHCASLSSTPPITTTPTPPLHTTRLHGSNLVSTRVALLGVTMLKSMKLVLLALSLGDNSVRISLGETLQALCVGSDRVGDSTSVDVECLHVEVLEGITLLMVVWIVPLSNLSTKELDLSLSLDTLSTSEETSSGDSNIQEWAVIGATRELGWDGLLAD